MLCNAHRCHDAFWLIVQDGYSLGDLRPDHSRRRECWRCKLVATRLWGAGRGAVGLLIGSTLVIGLTADRTIADGQATVADHTHAFDPFTRLHEIGPHQANISWVANRVRKCVSMKNTAGTARHRDAGRNLPDFVKRIDMSRFLVDKPSRR